MHPRSPSAFPLTALPPELQFLILAHLAPRPHTYRALTRVSHTIYALVLRACLPHTPIAPSTPAQLPSFTQLPASLLNSTLHIPALTHRLLVYPLRRIMGRPRLDAPVRADSAVRPAACSMARLAHLSYRALGRRGKEEEEEMTAGAWEREGLLPALREVVVTSSRPGKGKGADGGQGAGCRCAPCACAAGLYRDAPVAWRVARGGECGTRRRRAPADVCLEAWVFVYVRSGCIRGLCSERMRSGF